MGGGAMNKSAYFASRDYPGWPQPQDIERYFLAPQWQRSCFGSGNDSAAFEADGIDGTDHVPRSDQRRSNIRLTLVAHPTFGVTLQWSKWDGRQRERNTHYSRGDLARVGQFVWDLHGSLNPVALFVPYETAWNAVKEFLDHAAALPKNIEWIASDALPPATFAEPIAPRSDWKKVTCLAGVINNGWPRAKDIEHYFSAPPT